MGTWLYEESGSLLLCRPILYNCSTRFCRLSWLFAAFTSRFAIDVWNWSIVMSSSGYMAEPPVGQIRHYYNAPTAHGELTATGVSTTVIAAVAVALRIFTRVSVTKNGVKLEDCTYQLQ
jgi:hypothetical protein